MIPFPCQISEGIGIAYRDMQMNLLDGVRRVVGVRLNDQWFGYFLVPVFSLSLTPIERDSSTRTDLDTKEPARCGNHAGG